MTYHECLRYVGLAVQNSAQIQQSVDHIRTLLRWAIIKVGNKSKSGISTTDLKAVFEANWQSMERADDLAFGPEGIQMLSSLLSLFEEDLGETRRLTLNVSDEEQKLEYQVGVDQTSC